MRIILNAANQEAAAIAKEYEALGVVVGAMVRQYGLGFGGLLAFLENRLVRTSANVDLVLPSGAGAAAA